MSKEGVSANTESVLRENETKANHMLTLILNVTILVVAVTWLLFESGFFYIRIHFRALMIFNVVIMGIASGISRYFKYEKKWIKYLLMGTLTLVYAGASLGARVLGAPGRPEPGLSAQTPAGEG